MGNAKFHRRLLIMIFFGYQSSFGVLQRLLEPLDCLFELVALRMLICFLILQGLDRPSTILELIHSMIELFFLALELAISGVDFGVEVFDLTSELVHILFFIDELFIEGGNLLRARRRQTQLELQGGNLVMRLLQFCVVLRDYLVELLFVII